jgi:hypothetical protein
MGSKKPPAAKSQVPDQAPDPDIPPMEFLEYAPPGKRKNKMPGGAVDPYERDLPTGDTVRVRRPRTDLRQLSRWIKIKKEVEANREGSPAPPDKSPVR